MDPVRSRPYRPYHPHERTEPLVPARVRPLAHRTLVLARRTDTVVPPAVDALAAALATVAPG